MTHPHNQGLINIFPAAPWLLLPATAGEVVSVLSTALGADWAVERETDCEGEVSIIALPAGDVGRLPAFILYEKNGQTRIATVRSDEWERDRGFASFRQAVDALIVEARASSNAEQRLFRPARPEYTALTR
jgi:hypothetical protein